MEANELRNTLIAEQDTKVLLGSCFWDNDIASYISYGVKDWYFDDPRAKAIFNAIVALENDEKKIDVSTVYSQILKMPEAAGLRITIADISSLAAGTPQIGVGDKSLTQAIERIRESARIRFLELLSIQMSERIRTGEGTSVDIKSWFEESLDQLEQQTNADNSEGFEILGDYADYMAQMYKDFRAGKITALQMPFPSLGHYLGFGGLMPKDLVILAAHTSFGKTTLALAIARYVIDTQGDVAMFSLEMSKESLFMKIHSSVANMDSSRIRPEMTEDELQTLLNTIDEMRSVRLFTDTRTTDLYEMRAKAKRLKKRNKNLKLIIVDYLQLIGTHSNKQSEKERIADVSRHLKLMAVELDIAVIALSQFSRDSYKSGEEPKLSDLYGSGSIEKDADHVWFIHGEKPEHGAKIRLIELIGAKQRKNGGLFRVPLIFWADTGKFGERAPDKVEARAENGTVIASKGLEYSGTVGINTDFDYDMERRIREQSFDESYAPKDEDIEF